MIYGFVSLVHYLICANVEAESLEEGVARGVGAAFLPQLMLNLLDDTVGDHFCFSSFVISHSNELICPDMSLREHGRGGARLNYSLPRHTRARQRSRVWGSQMSK